MSGCIRWRELSRHLIQLMELLGVRLAHPCFEPVEPKRHRLVGDVVPVELGLGRLLDILDKTLALRGLLCFSLHPNITSGTPTSLDPVGRDKLGCAEDACGHESKHYSDTECPQDSVPPSKIDPVSGFSGGTDVNGYLKQRKYDACETEQSGYAPDHSDWVDEYSPIIPISVIVVGVPA